MEGAAAHEARRVGSNNLEAAARAPGHNARAAPLLEDGPAGSSSHLEATGAAEPAADGSAPFPERLEITANTAPPASLPAVLVASAGGAAAQTAATGPRQCLPDTCAEQAAPHATATGAASAWWPDQPAVQTRSAAHGVAGGATSVDTSTLGAPQLPQLPADARPVPAGMYEGLDSQYSNVEHHSEAVAQTTGHPAALVGSAAPRGGGWGEGGTGRLGPDLVDRHDSAHYELRPLGLVERQDSAHDLPPQEAAHISQPALLQRHDSAHDLQLSGVATVPAQRSPPRPQLTPHATLQASPPNPFAAHNRAGPGRASGAWPLERVERVTWPNTLLAGAQPTARSLPSQPSHRAPAPAADLDGVRRTDSAQDISGQRRGPGSHERERRDSAAESLTLARHSRVVSMEAEGPQEVPVSQRVGQDSPEQPATSRLSADGLHRRDSALDPLQEARRIVLEDLAERPPPAPVTPLQEDSLRAARAAVMADLADNPPQQAHGSSSAACNPHGLPGHDARLQPEARQDSALDSLMVARRAVLAVMGEGARPALQSDSPRGADTQPSPAHFGRVAQPSGLSPQRSAAPRASAPALEPLLEARRLMTAAGGAGDDLSHCSPAQSACPSPSAGSTRTHRDRPRADSPLAPILAARATVLDDFAARRDAAMLRSASMQFLHVQAEGDASPRQNGGLWRTVSDAPLARPTAPAQLAGGRSEGAMRDVSPSDQHQRQEPGYGPRRSSTSHSPAASSPANFAGPSMLSWGEAGPSCSAGSPVQLPPGAVASGSPALKSPRQPLWRRRSRNDSSKDTKGKGKRPIGAGDAESDTA